MREDTARGFLVSEDDVFDFYLSTARIVTNLKSSAAQAPIAIEVTERAQRNREFTAAHAFSRFVCAVGSTLH